MSELQVLKKLHYYKAAWEWKLYYRSQKLIQQGDNDVTPVKTIGIASKTNETFNVHQVKGNMISPMIENEKLNKCNQMISIT